MHGRKCLLLVCLPKTLGERRKQLKCSPPSLVAYPRFLLLLPSVYSAHRHRNRVVPLVREESTPIASFARLTTSVDRPAIDTYVHAPYRSIVLLLLYSIHKPFCKSILYSIYKSFCKSIHKTIFGINESVYLPIKIIILFLSHFAFHMHGPCFSNRLWLGIQCTVTALFFQSLMVHCIPNHKRLKKQGGNSTLYT